VIVRDTLVPDALVRDTLVPDTLVPDTLVPDTLAPDTLVPDTFFYQRIETLRCRVNLGLCPLIRVKGNNKCYWLSGIVVCVGLGF
jgi:hypothetical protein